MKSFVLLAVCAALMAVSLGLVAGCAQNRSTEVGLAVMHLQVPPIPPERRAYVSRHNLIANQVFRARFPTHAVVSGEGRGSNYHHFNVIFGSAAGLPTLMEQNQNAVEEAEGRFVNPEPGWKADTGYAYMWGWWPIGYTPFVRVGAEGRAAILVFIDLAANPDRHRIVLLSGSRIEVVSKDDPNVVLGEIAENQVNWAIDVWDDNGTLRATPPYELPAADPLRAVSEKLAPLQKFIDP